MDSGRLETVSFNPIERSEFSNPFSKYLDPNSNFVTRLRTSKYVVEEELNDRSDYVINKVSFSNALKCNVFSDVIPNN